MNIISCPGWERFKWCWCWLVKSWVLHCASVVLQDAVIRPHPGHCQWRNQKLCWLRRHEARCPTRSGTLPWAQWSTASTKESNGKFAFIGQLLKFLLNGESLFSQNYIFFRKSKCCKHKIKYKVYAKVEKTRGMSRIHNIYRYSSISIIGGVHQTVNQTLTRLTPMSHVKDSNRSTKLKQI